MKLTTCGNYCDACKAYRPNIEKLNEREALCVRQPDKVERLARIVL